MTKPIIAIIGRPNVGKSTLFNRIAGKRISIVDDQPNVTRDRVYAEADWNGKNFLLVDTGGFQLHSNDAIINQIREQAEIAISTADIVLFVVDVNEGITVSDIEVAEILRRTNKPVFLVVNKVDYMAKSSQGYYEFFNIGIGEPICVSAIHGLGIGDLLDKVVQHFPDDIVNNEDGSGIKVAVIGKPNSGKSSLVNKLLGEERIIISDIPGTTRDAIDTYLEKDGQKYTLIDTAGLRRKSKVFSEIEKYSIIRSLNAIERADVCLIMLDANEGITEQDKKVAGYAHEQGKASAILINKWDLVEKQTGTLEKFREKVCQEFAFMQYAPILFISAKTGQRVDSVLQTVKQIYAQSVLRIATGILNEVINEATAIVQPPTDKGKRLKIFYITQVSVQPPTFSLFINDKELMHYSYERYIENQIRKNFGFEGTPIRFVLKQKGE